ncbi:MAG: putative signal transducing protein [Candidatus Acidiferrales bacterium]
MSESIVIVRAIMANPNSDEMKPDLVTIRTFIHEFEAIVAKSALEAAGINCMITADDCAGLQPSLSMAQGIRLVVRSDDADQAEEVLTNAARNSN